MSFIYCEGLDQSSRSRYDQKLKLIGLQGCPYKFPAGVWKNDPTKWPQIEYGDIHNYLVDSPGIYTRESMKNYKSLEAHNYFRSGWVETVYSHQLSSSQNVLLKANVKPSQKLGEKPHCPWIAASKTGQVLVAHCTCMAELAESCSHIAAVLFKIKAAVRLGYTTRACTDEPCKWNQDFVKKIGPDPVAKINFYSESKVEAARKRNNKRKFKFEPATVDEQKQFLDALSKVNTEPVVLSCFDEYSENFHWKKRPCKDPKIPSSLQSLYCVDNIKLSESELKEKCSNVLEKVKLSEDIIEFVNKSTTNQSDSLVWHEQRTGRVTSTTVHAVMHTNPDNPAKSLIMTICKPRVCPLKSEAVQWGNRHENDALRAYEHLVKQTNEEHQNVTIKREGFKIAGDAPFIGVSADSVMTCDCHGRRVVEVKCPYSARDKNFKSFLESTECYLDQNKLKKTHKYYSQVQLQMHVYDVASCNFVIWAPKFVIITYVAKDNDFIQEMLVKCRRFFMRHILPELLTRKLENSASITVASEQNKENSTKLYCVCQMPEDEEEYVGCDTPQCTIEWFHLRCLKLKRKPKRAWFCPTCRKLKS